jgi:hypothetical protein
MERKGCSARIADGSVTSRIRYCGSIRLVRHRQFPASLVRAHDRYGATSNNLSLATTSRRGVAIELPLWTIQGSVVDQGHRAARAPTSQMRNSDQDPPQRIICVCPMGFVAIRWLSSEKANNAPLPADYQGTRSRNLGCVETHNQRVSRLWTSASSSLHWTAPLLASHGVLCLAGQPSAPHRKHHYYPAFHAIGTSTGAATKVWHLAEPSRLLSLCGPTSPDVARSVPRTRGANRHSRLGQAGRRPRRPSGSTDPDAKHAQRVPGSRAKPVATGIPQVAHDLRNVRGGRQKSKSRTGQRPSCGIGAPRRRFGFWGAKPPSPATAG